MKRYSDRFLRIAFFIQRSSKLTREWFRGTMLYTRHNPKWFVRIFELGNGHDEELLDFGSLRPDGIVACGVPVRFLQKFFGERGMGDVPIMAFPQEPYLRVGTVRFDGETIAQKAIELFKRRGCRHVAYVGTHLPNGVRLSRSFTKVLPRLTCGFKDITERASTQDPRGSGRLTALACDYIAKNACRPGGLDQFDIARHLGVSIRTLQMRFKETAVTHSILNEIQRVQLAHVCRLLATTDRSITDITFSSGFGSLSRLKAIFQKKFGMSMRNYRKLSKNSTPPLKVKEL